VTGSTDVQAVVLLPEGLAEARVSILPLSSVQQLDRMVTAVCSLPCASAPQFACVEVARSACAASVTVYGVVSATKSASASLVSHWTVPLPALPSIILPVSASLSPSGGVFVCMENALLLVDSVRRVRHMRVADRLCPRSTSVFSDLRRCAESLSVSKTCAFAC
jgi:hypothetical protein